MDNCFVHTGREGRDHQCKETNKRAGGRCVCVGGVCSEMLLYTGAAAAATATDPMLFGGKSAPGHVTFNATTGDESCFHTPLMLVDLPPPCVPTAGLLHGHQHSTHN